MLQYTRIVKLFYQITFLLVFSFHRFIIKKLLLDFLRQAKY